MQTQSSRFNRLLLALLVILFLASLAYFNYGNYQADPEHMELWNYVVSSLILSLPLALFFGAIYVLASAWLEYRLTGTISPALVKVFHWAPRLAAIVIIFFVSLFSLDVFGMEGTLLEKLGGFLMHSLPAIILIVLLVIAWRRPVVGFVAFLLAGLVFLRFVFFGAGLSHFLLFSGPLLLIAALFYIDWRWHKTQPPASLDAAA